ncbi:MAG: hypothetical protein MUC89_11175 [Acetobacteraceae bacterium]|nr:hypothetical protein [Acetobacteraceae bacterium]
MDRATFLALVKLPFQIVMVGAAIILVLKAAQWIDIPGVGSLAAALNQGKGLGNLAALLVFLVGMGVGVFAWWLASKFFAILRDPNVPAERLASLKDLPLALPEGTVRALLALIVGLVGLPILLFSKSLDLTDAIAGYINGIIMSVFAFYFGTRVSAGDAQTARQLAGTLSTVQGDVRAAEQRATAAEGRVTEAAADATRPTRLQEGIGTVDRHLAAAEVLVNVLGPALPKGLIPDGAADVLRRARSAAEGARAIAGGEITEASVGAVVKAGQDLLGGSPVAGLLGKAAGALPSIGALGPVAGVAIVLGLGWQLGSAEYRRWRARVLAAPYESKLIDFGVITPSSAEVRMERCAIFSRVFAAKRQEEGFFATLLDAVARDDAPDRLWTMFGGDAALFASREEMQEGLDEFRRALLADQAANDVKPETVAAVATTLGVAPPSVDAVNKVLDAGVNPAATDEEKAALEALVMMVGNLRDKKIDPAQLIAELQKATATETGARQ